MNSSLKLFCLEMASHLEHDCVHALIEDADEILEYISTFRESWRGHRHGYHSFPWWDWLLKAARLVAVKAP